MNQASVECPQCGTAIDVDDILRAKVEKELRTEYETKKKQDQDELASKEAKLKDIQARFVAEKEAFSKRVRDEVAQKLKSEKKVLEEALKSKINEEKADELKTLQRELNEKSEQVKELNRTKAEIQKLQREKDQIKAEVELASEIKLNKILADEKARLASMEAEKSEMKLAEKNKVIDQLNMQLKEAQRKAEQGSMQLQGEVQELAIESWLMKQFPLDTIEEIKKGARGGDCIQIVNTRETLKCGTIYYESKRTKDWQPSWIEKFKIDMRVKGADIGVIVTEAMPKNMERMGLNEGIWVCTFKEFKGLCLVLRQQIIAIHQKVASQENKGDKMEMLYSFLTSNEFRMQIEGIVGAFTTMQEDLLREQRLMKKQWSQRQKQIERVIDNTVSMYGSIRGIAGNAIATVTALELDSAEGDDDNSLV